MKKLLPKTSTNTQGFTLVELLVVIAIIAILAVIGTAVFSGIQKNARDAARRSDVKAISTALDAAKVSSSNTYPPLALTMFAGGVLPKDPVSTRNYCISWSLTSANTYLADPAAWTTTCTAGTANAASSAWSVPAAGAPAAATAYGIRVCAALEDGVTVVCSSTQQ